jgi:hypothetical protein
VGVAGLLVLSESGFLHCFDTDAPLEATATADRTPSVGHCAPYVPIDCAMAGAPDWRRGWQLSMSVRHAAIETPQHGRVPPVYTLEVVPPAGSTGAWSAVLGGARAAVFQLRTLQETTEWAAALGRMRTETGRDSRSALAVRVDEEAAEDVDGDGALNDDFVLLSVAARAVRAPDVALPAMPASPPAPDSASVDEHGRSPLPHDHAASVHEDEDEEDWTRARHVPAPAPAAAAAAAAAAPAPAAPTDGAQLGTSILVSDASGSTAMFLSAVELQTLPLVPVGGGAAALLPDMPVDDDEGDWVGGSGGGGGAEPRAAL